MRYFFNMLLTLVDRNCSRNDLYETCLYLTGFQAGEVYNLIIVDTFQNRFSECSDTGQSMDIFHSISLSTLNVILKCAFSYEVDVQTERLTKSNYTC